MAKGYRPPPYPTTGGHIGGRRIKPIRHRQIQSEPIYPLDQPRYTSKSKGPIYTGARGGKYRVFKGRRYYIKKHR